MKKTKDFCLRFWAATMILYAAGGCSRGHRIDYSHVDLAQVSGCVTMDHQPVPFAQVLFHDVRYDTVTFGLTDRNGKYRLMFNSEKEGAEPGEKIVRIWTARGGLEFKGKIPPENLGRGKEKIPGAYNRNSVLNVTVLSSREKPGQTFDFELDSARQEPEKKSKSQKTFDEFSAEE
jgi:hypothetical protein